MAALTATASAFAGRKAFATPSRQQTAAIRKTLTVQAFKVHRNVVDCCPQAVFRLDTAATCPGPPTSAPPPLQVTFVCKTTGTSKTAEIGADDYLLDGADEHRIEVNASCRGAPRAAGRLPPIACPSLSASSPRPCINAGASLQDTRRRRVRHLRVQAAQRAGRHGVAGGAGRRQRAEQGADTGGLCWEVTLEGADGGLMSSGGACRL